MNKQKVYWAASLHSEDMRSMNESYAKLLEHAGYAVLLPQRHGIWEDMMREEMAAEPGLSAEKAIMRVKHICYEADMHDLQVADACILYCPKIPSEGAVFEFAYMSAKGKRVCIFCPDCTVYRELNLMIKMHAPRFDNLDDVLSWLPKEGCDGCYGQLSETACKCCEEGRLC